MSVVWLACSLVLSSVEWSGEAEAEASQFQTSEADAFPGHLQGFFDLASVDLVNLSTVHNRLSLFEPTRLSLHGFSWTSLRYEIDGVHLWHPLMDGEPAVALSPKRFGTMALLREHGRLPTLSYLRPKLAATSRFFVAEFVTPVVGTTLLPHGFMDREPALPTNTPRRQENSGYRVVMKEGIQQPLWNAELGVELNQSNRQFPTLLDAQSELVKESAWEAQGDLLLEHRDTGVTLRALGRQMSRPQSGAEYRFSVDETSEMTRSDLAFIVSQPTTADYRWSVGLALSEKEDSRSSGLPPRDLADEWTQMQRRQAAGRQRGLSITSSFELDHEVWGQPGQLEIEFGERVWEQAFDLDDGIIDPVVWDNGAATRGVSFAALDQGGQLEGEQGYLSVEERWGLAGENRSLQFLVGTTGQWAQRGTELSWYALGFQLGANFEAKLNDSLSLAVGLGMTPQRASKSLVEFLDVGSPSGEVYRWVDDGDLVAAADEGDATLRRFGGAYHRERLGYWMPHHLTWTLGIGENDEPGFFWFWQGTANLLIGQPKVSYDEATMAQFEPREIVEPGGDGLGEDGQLDSGGQVLTVYDRTGSAGNEYYELVKTEALAQFWGMSLEFGYDEPTNPWMWRVTSTAYLSLAETPFGIFSDRNDVGIVDAASADPNAQVNSDGRSDACRAFGVNIDVRYRFSDALNWFLTGRYRDGQPFTRIWVEESLSQGPVAVMAVGRGDPVPRFTFHMTLDTALDWNVGQYLDHNLFLNMRLTNILNSGTELLEEVRTGDDFRLSLEMVPTRSLWIALRLEG